MANLQFLYCVHPFLGSDKEETEVLQKEMIKRLTSIQSFMRKD